MCSLTLDRLPLEVCIYRDCYTALYHTVETVPLLQGFLLCAYSYQVEWTLNHNNNNSSGQLLGIPGLGRESF